MVSACGALAFLPPLPLTDAVLTTLIILYFSLPYFWPPAVYIQLIRMLSALLTNLITATILPAGQAA